MLVAADTDGTRHTKVVLVAVRCRTAAEMVAFDDTLETFTFGHARHFDGVAGGKGVER